MKYKDKFISVATEAIPIFDTDRPTQALVDLFNPENNQLAAQSKDHMQSKCNLHEFNEPVAVGINDISLHCIMPIIIYGRKSGIEDEFFSVSNKLVIKQSELARDLLVSVKLKFFDSSNNLLDGILKQ